MAEDQVEGRRRGAGGIPGGVDDMRRVHPRFGSAFEVIFQPDDLPAKRGEVLHVHAHATSIFEDAACEAFPGGADDHFQPALLTRPPDVGGFAAQGGFIKVSLSHTGYYILHVFIAYAKILSVRIDYRKHREVGNPHFSACNRSNGAV